MPEAFANSIQDLNHLSALKLSSNSFKGITCRNNPEIGRKTNGFLII